MLTWISLTIVIACYLGLVFVIARKDSRNGGLALVALSAAHVLAGCLLAASLSHWEIARASVGDTSEAGVSAWIASLVFAVFVLGVSSIVPALTGTYMLLVGRRPGWADKFLSLRGWERTVICFGTPAVLIVSGFFLVIQ